MDVALKVDVDTRAGMAEGVPRLRRMLNDRGIPATFFITFGPDNSGKAIRRIFRPGFLSKMLRTRAVRMYGWKTMLYGTLLPPPLRLPTPLNVNVAVGVTVLVTLPALASDTVHVQD